MALPRLTLSRQVAFSPDGSRFARASFSGGVALFDSQTGEELFTLDGDCAVAGVDFSPDGSRLVTVDGCYTMKVWAHDIDDLLELARQLSHARRSPTRNAASICTSDRVRRPPRRSPSGHPASSRSGTGELPEASHKFLAGRRGHAGQATGCDERRRSRAFVKISSIASSFLHGSLRADERNFPDECEVLQSALGTPKASICRPSASTHVHWLACTPCGGIGPSPSRSSGALSWEPLHPGVAETRQRRPSRDPHRPGSNPPRPVAHPCPLLSTALTRWSKRRWAPGARDPEPTAPVTGSG